MCDLLPQQQQPRQNTPSPPQLNHSDSPKGEETKNEEVRPTSTTRSTSFSSTCDQDGLLDNVSHLSVEAQRIREQVWSESGEAVRSSGETRLDHEPPVLFGQDENRLSKRRHFRDAGGLKQIKAVCPSPNYNGMASQPSRAQAAKKTSLFQETLTSIRSAGSDLLNDDQYDMYESSNTSSCQRTDQIFGNACFMEGLDNRFSEDDEETKVTKCPRLNLDPEPQSESRGEAKKGLTSSGRNPLGSSEQPSPTGYTQTTCVLSPAASVESNVSSSAPEALKSTKTFENDHCIDSDGQHGQSAVEAAQDQMKTVPTFPPAAGFPGIPGSGLSTPGCFSPMLAAAAMAAFSSGRFPGNSPLRLFPGAPAGMTTNHGHQFPPPPTPLPPHGLFLNPEHFEMMNSQFMSHHFFKSASENGLMASGQHHGEQNQSLIGDYSDQVDGELLCLGNGDRNKIPSRRHDLAVPRCQEEAGPDEVEEDIAEDEGDDAEHEEDSVCLEGADPAIVSESADGVKASRSSGHQWTFEEQFKQLYILSEDPKRKEFLDGLFAYMQRRGTPVNRIPIMAKQVLDLYELFHLVVSRGGLVEVINKKMWREITKGLNLPSSITSAAFTLRTQYMKYLYPYECDTLGLSTPNELQSAIDGNRREARRSSYSFEYPMMLPPSSTVGLSRGQSPIGTSGNNGPASSGLLGNNLTPSSSSSANPISSLLGGSVAPVDPSTGESGSFYPSGLHPMIASQQTGSTLSQPFPQGFLPFTGSNSLNFSQHQLVAGLNPLFGLTSGPMGSNSSYLSAAQPTSKPNFSSSSSSAVSMSLPESQMFPISSTGSGFFVGPRSSTSAGGAHLQPQLLPHGTGEDERSSPIFPTTTTTTARGLPVSSSSALDLQSSGRINSATTATTAAQNPNFPSHPGQGFPNSTVLAAAAAASLFGVGFPGFPGAFHQLGVPPTGIPPLPSPAPPATSSMVNSQSVGMTTSLGKDQMKVSSEELMASGVKRNSSRISNGNISQSGENDPFQSSNQPLNLAADEGAPLDPPEKCLRPRPTKDSVPTRPSNKSDERCSETPRKCWDQTKRSNCNRRQLGRRGTQECQTSMEVEELDEIDAEADCEEDGHGERSEPGRVGFHSGHRNYRSGDVTEGQRKISVSESDPTSEPTSSTKLFNTGFLGNRDLVSLGSPVKGNSDQLFQANNASKRLIARNNDPGTTKMSRGGPSSSSSETPVRRIPHCSSSTGGTSQTRKTPVGNGVESRKTVQDHSSIGGFPLASISNAASELGGAIAQNLVIHTQPGSPMGLPKNAIVVTMEMANILYQGVLFGQMKR